MVCRKLRTGQKMAELDTFASMAVHSLPPPFEKFQTSGAVIMLICPGYSLSTVWNVTDFVFPNFFKVLSPMLPFLSAGLVPSDVPEECKWPSSHKFFVTQ